MIEIEKNLWARVSRYGKALQLVPFLRMVAVCNNLAFGKVTDKSDIDIFIIARTGRLFTVRILVTTLFHLLGVRRHGEKIAGRFCLSFFVDDRGMDLSKIAIDNDVYLAYWIKSMKPIIDINEGKELFNQKNLWISEYFDDKNFEIDRSKLLKKSRFRWYINSFLDFLLNGWFGDFVEWGLKKWQIKRSIGKRKKLNDASGVIIGDHMLKFHNHDRRKYYRDLWLKNYGSKEKISDEKFLYIFDLKSS